MNQVVPNSGIQCIVLSCEARTMDFWASSSQFSSKYRWGQNLSVCLNWFHRHLIMLQNTKHTQCILIKTPGNQTGAIIHTISHQLILAFLFETLFFYRKGKNLILAL